MLYQDEEGKLLTELKYWEDYEPQPFAYGKVVYYYLCHPGDLKLMTKYLIKIVFKNTNVERSLTKKENKIINTLLDCKMQTIKELKEKHIKNFRTFSSKEDAENYFNNQH
jgi:nucleoid DNA-binding protein